jgi:hypothetical protein
MARRHAGVAQQFESYAELLGGTCMRCGSDAGFVIVCDSPRTWENRKLCVESCSKRPWTPCPKCSGRRVPQHVAHCAVAHPDARAHWKKQLGAHRALVAFWLTRIEAGQ